MEEILRVNYESYNKVYILYSIIFSINIILWTISTVNYCKSVYSLHYMEENNPDIDLTGISSFEFISSNFMEYSDGMSNLGTTGKIFFDCYEGECHYKKRSTCYRKSCSGSGKKRKCSTISYSCYDYTSYNDHSCSLDCRINEKEKCELYYCNSYYRDYYLDYTSCSRDRDSSEVTKDKSCYADNLVLFWRGLYYERINNTFYGAYTYLNSAVTAKETCPEGKKFCGILDDLGNKLCYPNFENCPINFITLDASKINNYNFLTEEINGKTIYYTNEAIETGKVFGGLFVDSDLLIKYNEEDCEILDEESITQLLQEHKNKLYRESLNFDPYKDNNINQKGKSYLKWCIPGHGKEKNITIIKELYEVYKFNISFNLEVIKPIKKMFINSYFVCLPGFILLLFILIFILCSFYYQNYISIKCEISCFQCRDSHNIIMFIILLISLILITIGSILSIINNKNLSNGKEVEQYIKIFKILSILNIVSFIFFILLILSIVLFGVFLCYCFKGKYFNNNADNNNINVYTERKEVKINN